MPVPGAERLFWKATNNYFVSGKDRDVGFSVFILPTASITPQRKIKIFSRNSSLLAQYHTNAYTTSAFSNFCQAGKKAITLTEWSHYIISTIKATKSHILNLVCKTMHNYIGTFVNGSGKICCVTALWKKGREKDTKWLAKACIQFMRASKFVFKKSAFFRLQVRTDFLWLILSVGSLTNISLISLHRLDTIYSKTCLIKVRIVIACLGMI